MERLDVEVQYRTAKWIFTNMMFAGEITLEEYTEIHKKLIERFDPPMKSVEAPGFYVQEAFDKKTQDYKGSSLCQSIYGYGVTGE